MANRITADRRPAEEFWAMRPDEFNAWRKKEDFPRILRFFHEHLKEFHAWQSEFNLRDDDLIEHGISEFLIPEDSFFGRGKGNNKYLSRISTSQGNSRSIVSAHEIPIGKVYQGVAGQDERVSDSLSFEPYLIWAIRNKLRVHEYAQNGRIGVTTIEGVSSPEYCRTYFLQNLELVKLGGLSEGSTANLGERMLQFVNLDFLTFDNVGFGSSFVKVISFSSARFWTIKASSLHFYRFFHTSLEKLEVESSLLDDWKMIQCEGHDCKISNSRLSRCTIGLGTFLPYFDNVDLADTELVENYERMEEFGFKGISELPRRMKTAFTARGQHHKAGRYFFMERKIEKREIWTQASRYLNVYLFPNQLPNRVRTMWSSRKESSMSVRVFMRVVWVLFREQPQRKRHYSWAFAALKEFLSFFSSAIQELWWGYGERPIRVLLVSVSIIILFAVLIHVNNATHMSESLSDSIYFSVVSFLTIGDSSFHPSGFTRAIVALEALLGILNLGLFISGFANKARY